MNRSRDGNNHSVSLVLLKGEFLIYVNTQAAPHVVRTASNVLSQLTCVRKRDKTSLQPIGALLPSSLYARIASMQFETKSQIPSFPYASA